MTENAQAEGSATQAKKDAVLAALLGEKYRLDGLEELSNYMEDQYLKDFVAVLAKITLYWLKNAEEANTEPLKHPIQFGEWRRQKLTITLAQIHALIPEQYQAMIQTGHTRPSIDAAWLDENVLNTLMWLNTSSTVENGSTVFGINIGSLIRKDLDDHYNKDLKALYLQQAGTPLEQFDACDIDFLDYLEQQIQRGEDAPEAKTFFFPASNTTKIVWFENYLGVHWTTIVIEVRAERWHYDVYNSAQHREYEDHSTLFDKMRKVQNLIQKISGFPEPKHPFSIGDVTLNKGPRQENTSDCGVFAFWSATEALRGREPNLQIDPVFLRLAMLRSIAATLQKRFPEDEVEVEENNPGGDDTSDDDLEVDDSTQGGKQDGDVECIDQDMSYEATHTNDKGQYESRMSDEEFQKLLDARLEAEESASEADNTPDSDGKDAFGLEPDEHMDTDNASEGEEEGDSYEFEDPNDHTYVADASMMED